MKSSHKLHLGINTILFCETKYISDDDYLRSIKGMEESIIQASNEPIENYVTSDKLDW